MTKYETIAVGAFMVLVVGDWVVRLLNWDSSGLGDGALFWVRLLFGAFGLLLGTFFMWASSHWSVRVWLGFSWPALGASSALPAATRFTTGPACISVSGLAFSSWYASAISYNRALSSWLSLCSLGCLIWYLLCRAEGRSSTRCLMPGARRPALPVCRGRRKCPSPVPVKPSDGLATRSPTFVPACRSPLGTWCE